MPEKQPKRLPAAACAALGDKSNFEKAAIKLKKEMIEFNKAVFYYTGIHSDNL